MNTSRRHPPLRSSFGGLLALSVAVCLSGCIALSNYSATSYEHLTQLKAYHLKFIDDFTTETAQPVDSNKVAGAESTGDLKFREAEAYAEGMKDGSRTYNIRVLREMFGDNVSWLMKGKTFGKDYAGEQKGLCTLAYDQAIRGERVRRGAPTE